MQKTHVGLVLSFALLVACAHAPAEEGDTREDELRTTYGELTETLTDQDLERWIALRSTLAAGLAHLCRDASCAGYMNLRTVRIACASTVVTRKLKSCLWILGGSTERVDSATSAIASDARVFTCPIEVGGTAPAMIDALEIAGSDALVAKVPATGKSFLDGLVDCFASANGPSLPGVVSSAGEFIEMRERKVNEAERLSWKETTGKLAQGFDQICGDTFCEGEYPDIAPLDLACAVSAGSGRVPHCSWSFAAAELSVDAKGMLVANATTRRCDLAIDAHVSDFTKALAGPDPLRAPLPGKQDSIYDALAACL